MAMFDYIAPCHFGVEAVLKKEIISLGYEIISVENGRVTFRGDELALCRANIFLRTAERILLKIGSFKAATFDELFEGTKELEWENYIPINGRFWVTKAASVKSLLYSGSDIQSIVKKAVVERLKLKYHRDWFQEDGNSYPLRVFIMNDVVTIALDSSGNSLHKRGYRLLQGKAPIAENLAASIIMLTPWHSDRILVDPFCGSGTIPIEAALMAEGAAPGMNRSFTAEGWDNLAERKSWYMAIEEANEMRKPKTDVVIQGYDMDPGMIKIARENAKLAGVDHLIHFQTRPVSQLSNPKKYGFVITNPPYGERLEDKEGLHSIYGEIGDARRRLDTWSFFIITSYEAVESCMRIRADKNRKIYNGMIKTYFYQFMGPKPPKKNKQ